MKVNKNIRHGAFETNSSSTHSISISQEKIFIPDSLFVDSNGVLEIVPGEFGWEKEYYYSAREKASYCLTWLKNFTSRDEDADLCSVYSEWNKLTPDRKEYFLRLEQMFIEVLKENTGAKEVRFIPLVRPSYYSGAREYNKSWGYIDHQSMDDGGGDLLPAWDSKETLASFIFNTNSILITDNDNN